MFKVVMQHDSMQCGAACLSMVCRHYGVRMPLSAVDAICPAGRSGVSMLSLRQGAERLGFQVMAGRGSVASLMQAPLPCILHWNQEHYVVLYKVSRDGRRFHIADPAKGRQRISRAELEKHWQRDAEGKGPVMFLVPGEKFMTHTEQILREAPQDTRRWRRVVDCIRPYRRHILQVALGMAVACLLQLLMPLLTQAVVDKGIGGRDISLVWLILLGEIMIVLGRTATEFVRSRLLLHVSMRVNLRLLSEFWSKLMRLPIGFFERRLTGDLLERMSDHSRVQSFLTSEVLSLLFSAVSFLVYAVVLTLYNPLLLGVFLCSGALYAGWVCLFLRRRKRLDYELFELNAKDNNKTYRLLTSISEVKQQGCGARRVEEWEHVQADLFAVQLKSLRLSQVQQAGGLLINELTGLLLTVLTASAVINGHMTLGAMMAVQYVIGQLSSPLAQFIGLVYSLQDVRISLERIGGVHAHPDEPTGTLPPGSSAPDLRFENVTFSYGPDAPEPAISDITLHLPAGETTAIVGASGSGKSTLLKLIMGWYLPTSGRLEVDGVPMNNLDLTAWRSRCGTVLQQGVVFTESIARNIAVDDDSPDEQRLQAAARAARIEEFIQTLPLGYETIVGADGLELSQGQKQRILIARALYRGAPLLLLDEATNSLDAANERAIVESLNSFTGGRTCVVVAHRLSTVRNASRIVVLDKGRICEQGTHEELIARRGAYWNLVKDQLDIPQ